MAAPRIAIIVGNAVEGDGRVIKTAVTARRLGLDVLLVGVSPSGTRSDLVIAGVPVARPVVVPSGSSSARIVTRRDGAWLVRPLAPLTFRSPNGYATAIDRRAARRQRTRVVLEGIKSDLAAVGSRSPRSWWLRARLNAVRARSFGLDGWFVVRRRAYVRPPIRIGGGGPSDEVQRIMVRELPVVAGYVDAMLPVLDEFAPDLIHANDVYMTVVGDAFAERTALAGRRTPWIYDAHEWVAGLLAEQAITKTIAGDRLERLLAQRADAIITVGDALADELVAGLGLAERPTVVHNAPPRIRDDRRRGGFRAALGLDADTPLLVYPGVVKPKRGVETVVDALERLPGVHLGLLADPASPHVLALLERAERLAVRDRVHVHPYVPPDEIAAFISDATVGIHPSTRYPNAEVAIPTKLLEYVQAELPVIVADTREMARFVTEHGIGEVFRSGDVSDFAAAVEWVLGDRERYRARYGPDLVDTSTWEQQEQRLAAVYGRLLGRELQLDPGPFRADVTDARQGEAT